MLSMLLFWDENGEIVGRLDHMVSLNDDGTAAIGLIDFEAHENAGGRLREITEVGNAVGAGTWPEWLGNHVHGFKVELHESPAPARAKIAALVHKKSGHRRERAAIATEIESRTRKAHAEHRKMNGVDADVSQVAIDLRDLLGGPDRPLFLDESGKTAKRPKVTRPNLPVVRR